MCTLTPFTPFNVLHWQGGGFGPYGGAWNDQWVSFFKVLTDANADAILEFLGELVEKTSDFSKRVDEIDWKYTPDS